MKNLVTLLLSVILFTSCSSTKKSTANNVDKTQRNISSATQLADTPKQEGLSFKTAVFVTEKSEMTGPKWEYQWIKQHYSDYKVNEQALVYQGNKPYDIITIQFSNEKILKLYFDISNYFGKF